MKKKEDISADNKVAFAITHIMDWCHDDGNEKLSPRNIHQHKKKKAIIYGIPQKKHVSR